MYKWLGMEKLTDEEAIEIVENGGEVYLLHDDNSEGACDNMQDLMVHLNHRGEVGLERTVEGCAEYIYDCLTDNASPEYSAKVIVELYKMLHEKGNCSACEHRRIIDHSPMCNLGLGPSRCRRAFSEERSA